MNATLAAADAITKPWATHDTRLIVVTVIGIAIIVLLIVVLKMHPFLSMVPWAMALVAIVIGLPMFFEIGLLLLLPVIVLVTQRSGLKLMRGAIPALARLSVLHCLIPPHPGPPIAVAAVHAQLGTTLALGIVVAIPTVILCGPLLSILIARVVPVGAAAY